MYFVIAALQESLFDQPPLEIADLVVKRSRFASAIALGANSRGEVLDRDFGAIAYENGAFYYVL